MEERAIDRLRKFARYARDKGVVKGENSFEAYCELSNRYIYNSIRDYFLSMNFLKADLVKMRLLPFLV